MTRLRGLELDPVSETSCGLAHIGTSGFSYREWKGSFYPEKLPAREWFGYYASRFPSIEINSTFYHPPTSRMLERWREAAPPSFRFVLKATRVITHDLRLDGCKDEIARMAESYRPLGESLSCILFQLPPSLKRDIALLGRFLGDLRRGLRGASVQTALAIEFRHPSWNEVDVLDLLAEHEVAMVFHDMLDSGGWAWRDGKLAAGALALAAAEIVERSARRLYLRFHGTEGKYVGRYGRERLLPWAELARSFLDRAGAVDAYFNNTMDAAAPRDARLLCEMLKGDDPGGADQ